MKNEKFLLINAIDYIERTVSSYYSKDYKGAILFLWAGLLLLFKYKLYLIHPSLIFDNALEFVSFIKGKIQISKPTVTYNKKTIDFNENLKRLKLFGGNDSLIFDYVNQFKTIQKMRNRTEHYIYDVKENNFLLIFHEIMPFINNFIEDELNENISKLFNNWDNYLKLISISDERFKRMEKYIKKNRPSYREIKQGADDVIIDCNNCGTGSMIIQDNILYCRYCEHEEDYNICSICNEVIAENDWDGFVDELDICQRCFNEMIDRR